MWFVRAISSKLISILLTAVLRRMIPSRAMSQRDVGFLTFGCVVSSLLGVLVLVTEEETPFETASVSAVSRTFPTSSIRIITGATTFILVRC